MSSRTSEDLEKAPVTELEAHVRPVDEAAWFRRFSAFGVETGGIAPVPIGHRIDRRAINVFSIWWTMSLNLLPIVTGITGTLSYGLSLRDASLTILFFSILTCIPVGYLSVPGPKTGLRQMVQARYSFGKYGVTIPIILNLCTLAGFCVIDCVLGGQALSAVAASADFSSGNLSTTVGIVIIAVVALVLSFFGVKVLHQYERYAWIPVFVGVLVATGCGGSKLHLQTVAAPAEAATVLSFGALIAGFFLPWGTLASDFVVYHDPDLPSWKIAGYTFSGLAVPSIPLMVLGAAIGGAVPQVDSWNAGYEAYSAGGILAAMLQPAGNFGKFILVLLALSVVGNVAGTMYCLTLNCQLLLPLFRRVPRALFAIVVTAVIIPVSIKAVTSFFDALENFIGIIGYWASCFVVILVLEHAYFRRQDWGSYDPAIYNDGRRLPTGLAALGAGVCAFGLIIPCMAQIPYTGPIAEKTGDIGFEVGWFLAGLLYIPFRTLEIRIRGRL